MHEMSSRFDPISEEYARFRPSYPASLMRQLKERFADTGFYSGVWFDIGCGTGIFMRQLADILPASLLVVGLDPSAAMREKS